MTYNFMLDAVQYFFGIPFLADTLQHICRTLPGVKRVPAVPMESRRIHMDGEEITSFDDELEAVLEEVRAALVDGVGRLAGGQSTRF
jgi:hypothetical protein